MSARPLRRAWSSAGLLLALLVALPASAAQVVEMRVGRHPTFTRVVFELDRPAGYRVERRSQGGETQLVVTLDASASSRTVQSGSPLLRSVALDGGTERSTAVIRLRAPQAQLKEMILGGPPRIVLDVVGTDAAMAPRPAPTQVARPAPAKTEPPQAEPPKPAPETAQPEPPKPSSPKTETAQPAPPEPTPPRVAQPAPPEPTPPRVAQPAPPEPTPTRVAQPAPPERAAPSAPQPTPDAPPQPPAPAVVAAKEAPAEKQPAAPAGEDAEEQAPAATEAERLELPERDAEAEAAARRAMEERLAAVRKAAAERAARERGEQAEKGAAGEPAAAPRREADAAEAEESAAESATDWTLIGSIAGGVLLVGLLAVLIARRRAIPNDIDVTTLAQERGDAAPSGAASLDEDASEAGASGDLFSAVTSEVAAAGKAAPSAPVSGPGLSEEEQEKGEDAMEQDVNLPMDRGQQASMPPVGAGGGDVASLVRELERRLAHVESRLEEETDARERLERQVAAQSEELRVQRAAIARTQRALRGLTRSDEDQATEPALRDPK